MENKTKVMMPSPLEVVNEWKIKKLKLKGWEKMDKHKAKMLEKAKNQEEQELTRWEELKNKTKVELPPLPKVLENAKNQEEQDFKRQGSNKVKIFEADSFASFDELTQDPDKLNYSDAANFVKNIK